MLFLLNVVTKDAKGEAAEVICCKDLLKFLMLFA